MGEVGKPLDGEVREGHPAESTGMKRRMTTSKLWGRTFQAEGAEE